LVIFFLSVGGFLSAYLLAHLSEGSLELAIALVKMFQDGRFTAATGILIIR
jgi:hypothetical protein